MRVIPTNRSRQPQKIETVHSSILKQIRHLLPKIELLQSCGHSTTLNLQLTEGSDA